MLFTGHRGKRIATGLKALAMTFFSVIARSEATWRSVLLSDFTDCHGPKGPRNDRIIINPSQSRS